MTDQRNVRITDDKSDDNERRYDKSGLEISTDMTSAHKCEADTTEFECPVCLQVASFPVQLPCRHIFCFLCVKGFANRSKRCAMCRQEIPADFFNEPKLLREMEIKEKALSIFDEGYQWFYEGRNGWWQYDERTSNELEKKYKNGDKFFELLIAGFLYIIDLENMRQCRRNDQTRRRKIKRDLRTVPDVKGIAGLRFMESQPVRPSGDGGETSQSNPISLGTSTIGITRSSSSFNPPLVLPSNTDGQSLIGDDTYLTPSAPNNTPQTPMTPADSQPGSLSGSQEDLSERFQQLHVNTHSATATNFPVEGYDDTFDNVGSDPTLQSNSSLINTTSQNIQQETTAANYCPDDVNSGQGVSNESGESDDDTTQTFHTNPGSRETSL